MDQNGPHQAKMDQNGPFWSHECSNPVRDKVIAAQMVVWPFWSTTLSDGTAATSYKKSTFWLGLPGPVPRTDGTRPCDKLTPGTSPDCPPCPSLGRIGFVVAAKHVAPGAGVR